MLSINSKLTLIVLTPLPIMSITIFYISKVIHQKSQGVQEQLSKLSNLSQETFSGIRVIKSFVKEKSNSKRFEKETNEYLNRNISLAKTNALFFPFMLLLIGFSTLLTIYIGGQEVDAGNHFRKYSRVHYLCKYANLAHGFYRMGVPLFKEQPHRKNVLMIF